MSKSRKYLIIGGAVLALSAIGATVAGAAGGDSDEQVTGPDANRAKAAAVKSVGGGRVVGVERDDGGAAWEVEIVKSDGSQVAVSLDGNLKQVGLEADDDPGADERGGTDD